MNIFSDPKKHALVAGGNLSPNKNINSVLEKMKLNIISNRMRSIDMQSITMPCHFTYYIYQVSPLLLN